MTFRVRSSNNNNNSNNNSNIDLNIFKEEINDYIVKEKYKPKEIGKIIKIQHDIDKLLKPIDIKHEKEIITYNSETSSWEIIKESDSYKYDLK